MASGPAGRAGLWAVLLPAGLSCWGCSPGFGESFVLTVSRGDVGASASFHVDCESILSLDLSLPCFAFARGQVRMGSSADERARSAADAPYATGLALGTYLTSPAARSQPRFACFIFLWGQLK